MARLGKYHRVLRPSTRSHARGQGKTSEQHRNRSGIAITAASAPHARLDVLNNAWTEYARVPKHQA
jgi:hypothetical protein